MSWKHLLEEKIKSRALCTIQHFRQLNCKWKSWNILEAPILHLRGEAWNFRISWKRVTSSNNTIKMSNKIGRRNVPTTLQVENKELSIETKLLTFGTSTKCCQYTFKWTYCLSSIVEINPRIDTSRIPPMFKKDLFLKETSPTCYLQNSLHRTYIVQA